MYPDEELLADATCLIYIAKLDAFDRAARCMPRLLVAPAVWREAVVDGERFGYTDAHRIRTAAEMDIVRRVLPDEETQSRAAALAATWRLGQGECETLAVARRLGRALVDDGRAARVAEAIGVEPISTLFLPALGAMRGMDNTMAIDFLRRLAVVANARAETVFTIEEFIRSRE